MKQTDAVEPPARRALEASAAGRQRLETGTGRFDLNCEGARGAAMSQTDTLSTMPAIRSDRAVPRSLVVLIEVPEVKAQPDASVPGRRCRIAGTSRRPSARPPETAAPPRGPHGGLCSAGPGAARLGLHTGMVEPSQPGPRLLDRRGDGPPPSIRDSPIRAIGAAPDRPFERCLAVGSPGVVVLSIEPAALAPGTDTEVPVIFPGYVLPDDSLEDSSA